MLISGQMSDVFPESEELLQKVSFWASSGGGVLLSCRDKALESRFPTWWPSTMGHCPFLGGEIQVDHKMAWL